MQEYGEARPRRTAYLGSASAVSQGADIELGELYLTSGVERCAALTNGSRHR